MPFFMLHFWNRQNFLTGKFKHDRKKTLANEKIKAEYYV